MTMKKALPCWELTESDVEVQLTRGLLVAYDKTLNMANFQWQRLLTGLSMENAPTCVLQFPALTTAEFITKGLCT